MRQTKLAQCFCPHGHCLLTIAFRGLPDQYVIAELRFQARALISEGRIQHWCPVCGADVEEWLYQVADVPRDETARDVLEKIQQRVVPLGSRN